MLALLFIIAGNILNGIGVYKNMKYSPKLGELEITIDGGSADPNYDPDRIPRRNRKEEDEKNDVGYKYVIAGICFNAAAAIVLLFDIINP